MPALTRYRQPESLPIRLHPRRVYILPTRFGLVFAVQVAMLVGALNFNNNPALLLALLVAATTMIGFHHNVGQ